MMISLLKLMRLYYALPLTAGFVVILYYLTAGNLSLITGKLALSCISLASVISAGYCLNDICDIEIDRINCPRRVLAAGKLGRKPAVRFSVFLFLIGLTAGAFCGLPFFFAISTIAFMLVLYDLRSKRIGIFKDILVASLMTSLYPLALTLTSPVSSPRLNVLLIHPFWIFLSSLGYEMLKDIRDMHGDSRIRGLDCNYCDSRAFSVFARTSILTAGLLTLLPFILGYCDLIYLAASAAAIILAVLSTFRKPEIAIRFIYAEIFIITAGSMADMMVYGP
ncbi:MAG: UbiA family prenyltransferase [Sedimentisphaeraceae bacterium JB056]